MIKTQAYIDLHGKHKGRLRMNLFNEIERVTQQYKINPRVYKLFLKLSEEERTNFLKDLLRLNEEQHETKI